MANAQWVHIGTLRKFVGLELQYCSAYECSNCGISQTFINTPPYFLYCPMCGARMEYKDDNEEVEYKPEERKTKDPLA